MRWEIDVDQGGTNKDVKCREQLTFSSCTSLDDVTPWCYTRIKVGMAHYEVGNWLAIEQWKEWVRSHTDNAKGGKGPSL